MNFYTITYSSADEGYYLKTIILPDSESLVPFSCYFPSSQATFLLIDFNRDFQHWTAGDEAYNEEKINW
jgi:hypothetical protein